MTVIFNGQSLSMGYVGLGVYANRVLQLLNTIKGSRIVVLHPAGQTLPRLPDGIETVAVPGNPGWNNALWGSAFWSDRLAAYARKTYPEEIYFCPSPSWAIKMPARTVVVVHDVIYRRYLRYQGKRFVRKLFLKACENFAARAWKVITISEFSKREILLFTKVKEERVAVIPNWIENSFMEEARTADQESIRKKYGLPERYWLYVGGYDYRKNVEFLIHAYARLKGEAIPALVLAGKIPTRFSDLHCDIEGAISASGVRKEKIVRPGMVDEAELAGVYAGAELFLFPSGMEGFGYPPAEALAAGTPVIASDIPSLREIFPPKSNSLQPLNEASWVTAMERAGKEPAAFRIALPKTFLSESALEAYENVLGEKSSQNE